MQHMSAYMSFHLASFYRASTWMCVLERESPIIQVLTDPNIAWLQWSYENWYFQVDLRALRPFFLGSQTDDKKTQNSTRPNLRTPKITYLFTQFFAPLFSCELERLECSKHISDVLALIDYYCLSVLRAPCDCCERGNKVFNVKPVAKRSSSSSSRNAIAVTITLLLLTHLALQMH